MLLRFRYDNIVPRIDFDLEFEPTVTLGQVLSQAIAHLITLAPPGSLPRAARPQWFKLYFRNGTVRLDGTGDKSINNTLGDYETKDGELLYILPIIKGGPPPLAGQKRNRPNERKTRRARVRGSRRGTRRA